MIFDSREFAKSPELLPRFSDFILDAVPSDWSPDGRELAIDALAKDGVWGVWIYSFTTGKYRKVGDGWDSSWLEDGHRLLCADRGKIVLIDTMSGNAKDLLAIPGEALRFPLAITQESKLVFNRNVLTSDIWTMRFDEK